jgi:hypothetical protein
MDFRKGILSRSSSSHDFSSTKSRKSDLLKKNIDKQTKTHSKAKKKQEKLKLNIRQAIHEALDDYTVEHISQYSSYEEELSPVSPVVKTPRSEEKQTQELKRRHSFDLQVVHSPTILAKESPRDIDEVILEPLAPVVEEKKKTGPTGSIQSFSSSVEMDFRNAAQDLYITLFTSSDSPIPIKSSLTPKQEKEILGLLYQTVTENGEIPPPDGTFLFIPSS